MATRSRHEGPVSYSLLDRLIDDKENPLPNDRAKSTRYFKAAVRRDLEWLLNSRMPRQAPHGKETDRSLYNYGLPELSSTKADVLKEAIRQAILKFEPRILNPRVIPAENKDQSTQALRFIIEGILHMEPNPEPVAFDTVLDQTSGQYKLLGDDGA